MSQKVVASKGFLVALALCSAWFGFNPEAFAQAVPPVRSVRVVQGDTLGALAARHGVSVQELMRLNKITRPEELQIGQSLKLPPAPAATKAKPVPKPSPAAKPPAPASPPAVKAPPLPPKPAEAVRWKFYGNTLVDWGGWKLHPGGVRVSLVQPTAAEVGPIRAQATAVAVHCSSLRQAWLLNGAWEPWAVPEGRSVAQQIVLDLCANVSDPTAPAVPPPSAP